MDATTMTTPPAIDKANDAPEVKLRSVCDSCTAAKVRCNGKVPCERCLKKGIECHYMPFKSRGGGGGGGEAKARPRKPQAVDAESVTKQVINRHATAEISDTMLDVNEKKTWSVFFTLYRSFGKGCSLFWFKQQLFKMLRFLERRAHSDSTAANALLRLTSWMTALGIDVRNPPQLNITRPPDFKYQNLKTPLFHASVEDLKLEAARRNLPTLGVTKEGKVEINDSFVRTFAPSVEEMQLVLEDSAGGFLPWCGDLLARILVKESDLILFLQGVANNFDAIGRPQVLPASQAIPSMNILHVNRKTSSGALQDVLCVVKAVQILFVDTNEFSYSSLVVFDIPDENEHGRVPSRARRFSETDQSAADSEVGDDAKLLEEMVANKVLIEDGFDNELELPPLPQDIVENDDDEWLDNLLSWASTNEQPDMAVSSLPIADDMFHMSMDQK